MSMKDVLIGILLLLLAFSPALAIGDTCGDGAVEGNEQCDPGLPPFCMGPSMKMYCNDFCEYDHKECDEECGAECETDVDCGTGYTCNTSTCSCVQTGPECGDQVLEANEQCDPPNTHKCDGYKKFVCASSCTWSLVGCDSSCGAPCTNDANCITTTSSSAGTTYTTQGSCDPSTCTCAYPTEGCGDGVVSSNEACDPPYSTKCEDKHQYQCKADCSGWEDNGCKMNCGAYCETDYNCQNILGTANAYCNWDTCECQSELTQTCPSGCNCMTSSEAEERGCWPCPEMTAATNIPAECGYDSTQEPLYCFECPYAASCPDDCECMTSDEAVNYPVPLEICQSESCGTDSAGIAKYCYRKTEHMCPIGCECLTKDEAAYRIGSFDIEQYLCSDEPCEPIYITQVSAVVEPDGTMTNEITTETTTTVEITRYCFKIPETQPCPDGCGCMTKEDAEEHKYIFCGEFPQVCDVQADGREMYCFKPAPVSWCGNGICEFNEDERTCCEDCGCSDNLRCINNQCAKPEPICEDPAVCMPPEICKDMGCEPVRAACRIAKPIYREIEGIQEVVSAPEVEILELTCCMCPEKPPEPECEREGGFCIYWQDECPQGFEGAPFSCNSRSEQCCMREFVPPPMSCEKLCEDMCAMETCPAIQEEQHVIAKDECNNGIGYSEPTGDIHCKEVDCCNWYVTTHVHDLGQIITGRNILEVTYAPGFAPECKSEAVISISADDVIWNEVARIPTMSKCNVDETDQEDCRRGWHKYTERIKVDDKFKYVKVKIDRCYNDYSSAVVISSDTTITCRAGLDKECFYDCMEDCAPDAPVSCNFNGVCDNEEDTRYCCTDCSGCEPNGFCDKESGRCVVGYGGGDSESMSQLAQAINRLADVLEKFMDLLSRITGQSATEMSVQGISSPS